MKTQYKANKNMKTVVLQYMKLGAICLAFLCSPCQVMWAQTVNNAVIPNNVVIPSPNAAEIGRFGAVPVGMFTGSMQYQVPIYELGNTNISLPISLQYSSNGFNVDKIASTVGYDWNLDAGGVINHYISGTTDSYISNNRDYTTQQGKTDLEKYYFLKNFDPVDIFTFTLPGISGSFYLDNNGKPVIIKKGDNLSITFDINSHQFTVKKDDGTQYIFADHVWVDLKGFECWYLSSINHPSGDHIDFKYSPVNKFLLGVVNREVYFPVLDQHSAMGTPNSTESLTRWPAADRYLERIDMAGVGAVVFTNSYNRTDSEKEPKVDEVTILNEQGSTIRKIKLNYTFAQSSSKYDYHLIGGSDYPAGYQYHKSRMFLNKVEFKDNVYNKVYSYAFQYNDINNLPCIHSYSKDYWGYFNGRVNTDIFDISDYSWIYTQFSANTYSSLSSLIDSGKPSNQCDRSANDAFSQKGMLSRISYPTSGYSLIYYEGHKNEGGELVGGCRVARVETFASDNATPEVKVYKYPKVVTNFNPSIYGKSSTYVLRPFRYTYQCGTVYAGKGVGNVIKLSSNLENNFTTGGYHLSYTKVEILNGANGENGSEEHEFWAVPQVAPYPIVGPPVTTPFKRFNTDLFNGTPIRIAYKKNNLIQKEVIYNYDFDNATYKESLVCNSVYYNDNTEKDLQYVWVEYKLERIECTDLSLDRQVNFYDVSGYALYSNFPYLKSKKETITDDNLKTIVTETFYEYCDAPYTNVRSVTVKESKGKSLTTVYKYPFDNQSQSPYSTMVSNKVTSPVIETQEYISDNAPAELKSTISSDYKEIVPGLYRPTTVYELTSSNPLSKSSYTTYGNGLITRGTNFKIATQVQYNTKGNPVKVVAGDGIPISYIWGYNEMYPIAKVVNALPTEIAYTSFESEDTKGGWTFDYVTSENSNCQSGCNSICSSAAQSACSSSCTSSCGGNPDCYKSCMASCTSGKYGQCMTDCVPGCSNGTETINANSAKTDAQSFRGHTLSKNLPLGYYRVGYWAKKSSTSNGVVVINGSPTPVSNAAWEYKEFTTSGEVTSLSINLQGVIIDDLSVCPKDARITLYSYKPSIGLTAMTDENGSVTTYEYDSFARLKLIKDNKGNILKQFQYNYQKP